MTSTRKCWSVVLVAALLLVLSAPTTFSAVQASMPGQNDLEKAVFVHYPHQTPQIGGAHGKPGGSALCPDPSSCTDNKWGGQKWASAPAVAVSPSGSGLDSSSVLSAVTEAFAAWSYYPGKSLTSSVALDATTDCDSAGASANTINQVCWRDLTSSYPHAIAVTFVWYHRSNKQIVEADTVFNNGQGFNWSWTQQSGSCDGYGLCNTDGTLGTYDLQDIGTHEFGHFLAFFGDLYNGRDAQLTMYGYGATGELHKDSLGKGDCLGITAAYGGSCP